MRKLLPNNYPMYDTVYGNDIPSDQYFVIKYDTISSKFGCVSDYDINIINYFISEGFKIESSISLMNKRQESRSELLLVNDKKHIMVRVSNNYDKSKSDLIQIDITYDIKRGEIEKQLDFKKIKEFEKPKKKAGISLVKSEMGHLDVEDYDLLCPEMNLELNYGSNFLKIHDVIVDRLNRNYDKGIILLHGDPGTGKCVTKNTKITVRNKKTGKILEINISDLM